MNRNASSSSSSTSAGLSACDPAGMVHPTRGVGGLQPYQPGKPIDELARELGLDPAGIIKLASNENPLGPSQKALAAVEATLAELCRYPDGNGFQLKQKLAQRFGVQINQITLGNGSNDVLELIARAYADTHTAVVYAQYAFAVYAIVTQAIGARHIQVPAQDWGHDLPAMAAAITPDTKLVFIANPNNPTGTAVDHATLAAFMAQVPANVLVVLDEAYCEYIDRPDFPDSLALARACPNLIITRTFSKAWGLAALRVGFAISSPQVADALNRVRQPFNVNALALSAATAVLDDQAYVDASRQLNQAGMQQLEAGFSKLGLSWIPSSGNFIAVDMGRSAAGIYQALLEKGVIVRPLGAYGMPRHLRISIGLASENARLLDALAAVLADAA